jgi:GTP-binding protein EngB required for normal cell division
MVYLSIWVNFEQWLNSRMSTDTFFDGLWDRHEVIEEAHKSTLQWIHDHQVLQEWMATKSRAIWAAGKAGCGKSTLSKHLLDHVITQKRQDRT